MFRFSLESLKRAACCKRIRPDKLLRIGMCVCVCASDCVTVRVCDGKEKDLETSSPKGMRNEQYSFLFGRPLLLEMEPAKAGLKRKGAKTTQRQY